MDALEGRNVQPQRLAKLKQSKDVKKANISVIPLAYLLVAYTVSSIF